MNKTRSTTLDDIKSIAAEADRLQAAKPTYRELEDALNEIAKNRLKEDPKIEGFYRRVLDGHDAAGFIRIARRALHLPCPEAK